MATFKVVWSGHSLGLLGAEKLDFRLQSNLRHKQLREDLLVGGTIGNRRKVIKLELDGDLMEHWVRKGERPSATPLEVGLDYDEKTETVRFDLHQVSPIARNYSTSVEAPFSQLSSFLKIEAL